MQLEIYTCLWSLVRIGDLLAMESHRWYILSLNYILQNALSFKVGEKNNLLTNSTLPKLSHCVEHMASTHFTAWD